MPSMNDYLGRVTSWHADKPRFMSVLAALVNPMAEAQAQLTKLRSDFDLDTAVGVQLDMLGQWIGRSRYLRAPIQGVFFALDEPTLRVGFDEGVWLEPHQDSQGVVALEDEAYRSLLKLQAAANSWDGTIPMIRDLLDLVFPGVVVDDRGDRPGGLMTMEVLIPGGMISTLGLLALEQDFPVKPSGVRVTFLETTVITDPLFGLDMVYDPDDPGPFAGFDEGAWGEVVLVL
jgi:Protein of unknown function (DUF2612)